MINICAYLLIPSIYVTNDIYSTYKNKLYYTYYQFSYIVSTVNALIISLYYFSGYDNLEIPARIITGYFLSDMVYGIFMVEDKDMDNKTKKTYYIHHILGLLMSWYYLKYKVFPETATALFATEISTIFMNINIYLLRTKRDKIHLRLINGSIFLLTFTYYRIFNIIKIYYSELQKINFDIFVLIFISAQTILNLYWTVKIVKGFSKQIKKLFKEKNDIIDTNNISDI